MKKDGSPCPNGHPASTFKCASKAWSSPLAPLFNYCYSRSTVPDAWRGSILCPIFKNGDPTKAANYRLITLLDLEANAYARALLVHLEAWVSEQEIFPYFQSGFRAGASTADNIIALSFLRYQASQRNQQRFFAALSTTAQFLTDWIGQRCGRSLMDGVHLPLFSLQ